MNKMTLLVFMLVILACNETTSTKENDSTNAEGLQLIKVIAENSDDNNAIMFLYERENLSANWKLVDSFRVMIGRNGMASGNKENNNIEKIKQEGDGCSPAGSFTLGTVFSYHKMNDLNMPFKQVDSNDLCVDDKNSVYYNLLIDTDTITTKDYSSFEYMHRKDVQYEYGVWVNYNTAPQISGNGSCIFLHVWLDENTATSGCTAMSKENILKVIHWLDAEKNPVLVQKIR